MQKFRGLFSVIASLLLISGCDRPSVPASSVTDNTLSIDNDRLIDRWHSWNHKRDEATHCAADSESNIWFIGGNTDMDTKKWACRIPAGVRLLVTPAVVSLPDPLSCRDADTSVGLISEASLDQVSLTITKSTWRRSASTIPPHDKGYCVTWAVTDPVLAGQHVLQQRMLINSQMESSVTVEITAE